MLDKYWLKIASKFEKKKVCLIQIKMSGDHRETCFAHGDFVPIEWHLKHGMYTHIYRGYSWLSCKQLPLIMVDWYP